MLLGVIADDFTGASDIANTLAKGVGAEGGLRTAQFPGIPTAPANASVEAGVVSLKTRSTPVDEAVRDSLSALKWLQDQGCSQFVFKYCSTFDSTPEGNIGPVADALADALGANRVVVCPAFPTTGRTVYQGHLFVNDTLLNESGMEKHPLTPMTDPDIRRWLRQQTGSSVGHVALSDVLTGPDHVKAAMARKSEKFIVADAVTDSDLLVLGAALSSAPLITGGSGIALGLPRNFERPSHLSKATGEHLTIDGPEAILAGSCSGATRGQIELHAKSHPCLPIDVPGVVEGSVTAATLLDFFNLNEGKEPLAFSSGTPEHVSEIQSKYGGEFVAGKLDALFAETARMLIEGGFRRIVVAGGETSGAVAQSIAETLETPAMMIGKEIDPGVPVLTLGDADPVGLVLKSGNFGASDFFSKALRTMGAAQ